MRDPADISGTSRIVGGKEREHVAGDSDRITPSPVILGAPTGRHGAWRVGHAIF